MVWCAMETFRERTTLAIMKWSFKLPPLSKWVFSEGQPVARQMGQFFCPLKFSPEVWLLPASQNKANGRKLSVVNLLCRLSPETTTLQNWGSALTNGTLRAVSFRPGRSPLSAIARPKAPRRQRLFASPSLRPLQGIKAKVGNTPRKFSTELTGGCG